MWLFLQMGSFWKSCKYLFLWMASFWKFWVYKFQPQRIKNKKNTVGSRDIWLMFLSISTGRQAGHGGKTCYWLILKDSELTNIFCAYFLYAFLWNMNFVHNWHVFIFVNAVYKRISCRFNFAKSTKICEICKNMHTWKLVCLSYFTKCTLQYFKFTENAKLWTSFCFKFFYNIISIYLFICLFIYSLFTID